eukprot:1150517-Prorocentrum_lima.AAC.1
MGFRFTARTPRKMIGPKSSSPLGTLFSPSDRHRLLGLCCELTRTPSLLRLPPLSLSVQQQ